MSNLNWSALSIAFKQLCVAACVGDNNSKSGDGTLKVVFLDDFKYDKPESILLRVELSAYCMPMMDRHHQTSNYDNEEKAMQGVRRILQKQIRFINHDRQEEGLCCMLTPDILVETEKEAKENEGYFNKYSNL